MIDPLRRWSEHGAKPDCAGPLSFAGSRDTEDPDEPAGAGLAIVGGGER